MTLRQKYEKSLKDSENYITNEKSNVTNSYPNGKILGKFFNKDLDYSDINVHYSYPAERFGKKEDWDLKLRFQLRKSEILKFAPLNGTFIYQHLSTLADSEWVRGEPTDSDAKELMRGMRDTISPIQQDLNLRSVSVEWAVHVPDCTTFFIDMVYAYPSSEEQAQDSSEISGISISMDDIIKSRKAAEESSASDAKK